MSETQIKAIETVYNGYRFRSRLEARWAVFFDALGVEYEYEKEGYDLGEAGWYLPDFWLPGITLRGREKGLWVEIKGQMPTLEEDAKCAALSKATERPVLLFPCPPFCRTDGYENENSEGFEHSAGHLDEEGNEYVGWDCGMCFWQCPGCGCVKVEFYEGSYDECMHCDWKADRFCSGFSSPRLIQAVERSRQARFEHGERVARP